MHYLILTLACWRLANLLVNEKGPMDTLDIFRSLLGIYHDGQGKPQGINVIAQAFTCIWCLSVWLGILLAISYYYWPNETIWIALPFSLSSGAIIVSKVING